MSVTVPVADPNRGYREWNIKDMFGHSTAGQIVPNKDDKVTDWDSGIYRVTDVDYSTNISTLKYWSPIKTPEGNQDLDVLLGGGPGQTWESFRAFLDTSVTPHTLTPERRLHMYSSDIVGYRVFRGHTDQVVSLMRDPSGNILGTLVPMRSVEIPGSDQTAIKYPAGGYTLDDLQDGELLTLIAYSAERKESEHKLVVKRTGAQHQAGDGINYITSIEIDTAHLSASDRSVIEFPLGVPVQALPMTAVVTYSTGVKVRYPIDDTRFSLWGRDNYIASVLGEEFQFTLVMRLNNDEASYGQAMAPGRLLPKRYTARTIAADGAYMVKLFIYPTWDAATGKYRLEYWLYNLDREAYYNVTNLIQFDANSDPFDPTIYGQVQTLTVRLDLSRVDDQFRSFYHPQNFQVTLLARGDENTNNWLVVFRSDQGKAFGAGAAALVSRSNLNVWTLDIKCGATTLAQWLDKLYYAVEPLRDTGAEPQAPRPTHFRAVFLHNTYEYAIEQWDQALTVVNDLKEGQLLNLQWIRRTPTTDLQLAITGLPVHQISL